MQGYILSSSFACDTPLPSYLQGAQRAPLAPATMLWLIQRDFLEGKTVQAMVKEALEPVSNPDRDPDIDQVN